MTKYFVFLKKRGFIQASQIHFKRRQSENYVWVAIANVRYSYKFYWFAIDTRFHFETLTWKLLLVITSMCHLVTISN